jgi:lysophospholipase L1-like esterase
MARRSSALPVRVALICVVASGGLSGCLGLGGDDEQEPAEGEHLIVSVGDSVASGEGNPASSGRRWLRPSRCHRAETSGPRIAAAELIAANPDSGLRFISYACSGATIDWGLLEPFRPRRFQPAEPPQLDRVDALTPRATIDALMISIGANDVGFSKIVTFCATERDCQDSRTFAPAERWAEEGHQPLPTLDAFVRRQLAELRHAYERVDVRVPSEIDRHRVLIAEYFDPTRWPPRTQCAIFRQRLTPDPEEGLVTIKESRWAHDRVLLPLNDLIHAAAEENGWTLVDRVDERFDGHGICAPKEQRWVRTLGESLRMQHDHLGTLHPNEAGHRATAELIRSKLAALLALSATSEDGS